MKRIQKNRKHDRGSLTVEAILFLIPFMCAYLTVINAGRFVQTEMLIHHAITQTGKQISTYSYVFTKSKAAEMMQGTNRKKEEFQANVDEAVSSVQQFANSVGSVGSSGDIFSDLEDIYESGNAAGENLSEFFSDPEAIASGVFAMVKGGIREDALTLLAGELSKSSIKSSISLISDDANEYLENLGVVGGLDGLNFRKSKWISNKSGKGDIQIVVTYQMKNFLFPEFDFGQHEFVQCASTLVW
ncbi:MAG: hypothetical protein KH828_04605 [Clostridiales bacterium]|nr:hypothetical protein [Clostridiales bacterium]